MGKAHFMIFCDRQLVDTAIQLILEADTGIEVVSSRTITCETIEETTDLHQLRRGGEQACLAIIIGDRKSTLGPFDGEYWIYVDGEPQGFLNYNEPFARELTEILIAHGARETRKRDSDDSGHQKKMGAAIDG